MYNLIDKGVIVPETANLKQRIFEEYLVDKWKPEDTRIKLKPVKNDQTAFGKLFFPNDLLIPVIKEGYYFFYDRHDQAKDPYDDAELYDRAC